MTKKTGSRIMHRETGNHIRKHDALPDKITLRDEIYELKRQVLLLKRTNEQYLVKLRKYEDEAKRKDKELEHLLDPRKNLEVTKILSTKGAAILMNLKDQNNALIKMILNKDSHIRRLVAEIKMSKLYASTKKNESCRAEINRLRNLLIKSRETLKENVDVQHQTRSICVSRNSPLEFSSSSDQSSPRDLDELRFTILSLESHINYSNDLLAKKNQEISVLMDELNFLRKFFRYKTYKNKTFSCDFTEHKDRLFSTNFSYSWPAAHVSAKISTQDIFNLFEKSAKQEDKNPPHSAPPACSERLSSISCTQGCSSQSNITEEKMKNQSETHMTPEVTETTKQKQFEKISKTVLVLGESLLVDDVKKEKEMLPKPKKTVYAKEKWKSVVKKYTEFKKLKQHKFNDRVQIDTDYKKKGQVSEAEVLGKERRELETTVNFTQNFQILQREEQKKPDNQVNSPGPCMKDPDQNKILRTLTSSSENIFCENEMTHVDDLTPKCQISEKNSSVLSKKDYSDTEELVQDCITQQFEKDVQNKCPQYSPEKEKELSRTHQKVYNSEESENTKSFGESRHQSLNSSFDSENSFLMKQEVQQMQVDVEINSIPLRHDSYKSKNNDLKNNKTFENKENGEDVVPYLGFDVNNNDNNGDEDDEDDADDDPAADDDEDDDDDVIVREK